MSRSRPRRLPVRLELLEDRCNPATTFLVTTTADSGLGSLRDALALANAQPNTLSDLDEIRFDPALNNQTIAIQSALPVANSVRIVGPGAGLLTIEHVNSNTGTAADRIFNVDDGFVDNAPAGPMIAFITGLTLTRGGGAIDSMEVLRVEDCVVTANHGTGIRGTANVIVERTTVSNNTGGGIVATGSIFRLTASTVSGNSSTGDGGGVRTSSVADVTDSTITGNTAAGNGGGVYTSGLMNVVRSSIANNQAVYGGGVFNATTVGLTSSAVTGNTASLDGGGFFGTGTLWSCTVDGNTAGRNGGGIALVNASNLFVSDSTVSSNTAGGSGGGVFYFGATNAGIARSSVVGNTSSTQTGGGVAVTNNSAVGISDSEVSGSVGGGIFVQGSTFTVLGTAVESNQTFGISAAAAATLSVENSRVSTNSGVGIAGDGTLTVKNSLVSGNAGDGIAASAGTATVTNTTVSGNTGAGISSTGILAATNATVVLNALGVQNGGTATLFNTIVAGNGTGDIAGVSVDPASANNLIGDPATSGGLADANNGNIVGTAGAVRPLGEILDPVLRDSGGATPTHKLAAGSPAVDAGRNAAAAGLSFDQRGSGFTRIARQTVDVGAYEFQASALVVSGQPDGSAVLRLPNTAGQYGTAGATVAPFGSSSVTVRSATADLNSDGFPDTVFVTGPGTPVRVTVISGADNTTVLLAPFDPFGGDFTGGGYVAAAGTQFAVTPDQGGGPRVVIFRLGSTVNSFLGIDDPAFRGGARPAFGDVNGDGTPDLLVAAGFGGGPRVALFDGTTLGFQGGRPGSGIPDRPQRLVSDFFAFPGDAATLRNGVFAALGDIDGDGFADLAFGGGPGGAPRVYVLSGQLLMAGSPNLFAQPVANFFVAGNDADRGGVRLAVENADDDSKADLAVGSGEGSPAKVRVYLGKNFTGAGEPAAFQDIAEFGGAPLPGGVFVG